jgi:drug/metabolite transporter (DMT)-like permease
MKTKDVNAAVTPSLGSAPVGPPRGLVVTAFAAVYLLWGSTYLGIRFAVETMPPFLMGGARFLLAGLILFICMRMRGVPTPGWAHWRNAILTSTLMLGVGNGAVNWAEQWVPSNLTALVIAATPAWFALLDWLRPGGVRPRRQTLIGIAIGFAGMMWMVGSRGADGRHAIELVPALVLLGACFCWALGSLYARYTPKPQSGLMGIALQMVLGGLLLVVVGLAAGETRDFRLADVTSRSWAAFFYLSLVGSLVGFTAYSWLLKVSTPEKVSTHAFINPVIAVLLGWALAGESLTVPTIMAAVLIVIGVMIITTRKLPFSVWKREGD